MKRSTILASVLSAAYVNAAPQTNAVESLATLIDYQASVLSSVGPVLQTNSVYSDVYDDITAVWGSATAELDSLLSIAATNTAAAAIISSYVEQLGPLISDYTTREISVPTGSAAELDASLAQEFLEQLTGTGSGPIATPTGDGPAATTTPSEESGSNTPEQPAAPSETPNAGPTAGVQLGMMGAAAAGVLGLAAML